MRFPVEARACLQTAYSQGSVQFAVRRAGKLKRDKLDGFLRMNGYLLVSRLFLVFSMLLTIAIAANAQTSSIASLTYPQNMAAQVSPNVQFAWTAVPGAQAYYLYVGSAPGLKDVYNSGETPLASLTVRLPLATKYYARIYTKINDTWNFSPDVSFTTIIPAAIVSPANRSNSVQNTVQFSWSASSGADAYYLYAGTTIGAKDAINSGAIQATQLTHSLSSGTYYARVYTLINGVWFASSDITFSVATPSSPALLTFPASGASPVLPTVPFAWNPVAGAQVYYLYVGSAPGLKDVYDGGETTSTSVTVKLSPSKQYYARLYTEIKNQWSYAPDVAFSTVESSSLVTPSAGSTFTGTSLISFAWTPVAGAACYYLYVGTTPGAKDIINSGQVSVTQMSQSLQPGTYYARIYTEVGQSWFSSADISFSIITAAILVSPNNGATNVDHFVSLSWTPVSSAAGYSIAVGTSPGGSDAFSTGTVTTTSVQTSKPLQAVTTYYATVGTLQGSNWIYTSSSFTTGSDIAHLSSPVNGAINVDPLSKLNWNVVVDAQVYYVYVGSALGLKDVYNSGELTTNSLAVPTLKPNTLYFARLYTEKNSTWYSTDSSFTTGHGIAQMVYPVNGATDVDLTIPFSWSTDPLAIGYQLSVGTTLGAKDVFDSGQTTDTSRVVPVSAPGTYYIRIYTKRSDGLHSVDSTFTLGDFISHLLTPSNQGVADPYAPFVWTAVPNTDAYYLYIGSSVGAQDVFGSGQVTVTSMNVPNLVPGTHYYARLYTFRGGKWHYSDSTFLAGQGVAQLTDPTPGAAISPFEIFTWAPPDGEADAYYLTIGSTPGARDVFDSGAISGTSIQPTGLDFGKIYYATLYTLKYNFWRPSNSTFTTLDQVSMPNLPQVKANFYSQIQQTTAAVRMMADPNTNVAVPGTPLANYLAANSLATATCYHYALVLVRQLEAASVNARLRYITLDGTSYESHTTAEYYDPFLQKWSIADATFGIVYFDPATQTGQSVEDVQALVLANNFAGIHVTTVTNYGVSVLRSYYVDPLTLYLNVYPPNASLAAGLVLNSPLRFLNPVSTQAIVGRTGYFLFSFGSPSEQMQVAEGQRLLTLTPLNGTAFSRAISVPSGWTLVGAPSDIQAYTFIRPVY